MPSKTITTWKVRQPKNLNRLNFFSNKFAIWNPKPNNQTKTKSLSSTPVLIAIKTTRPKAVWSSTSGLITWILSWSVGCAPRVSNGLPGCLITRKSAMGEEGARTSGGLCRPFWRILTPWNWLASAASAISPAIGYMSSPESSPEVKKHGVEKQVETERTETKDKIMQTSPPIREESDKNSEADEIVQSCSDLPPDSAVLHVRNSSTSLAFFSKLPSSSRPSDGSNLTKTSAPASTSSQYHFLLTNLSVWLSALISSLLLYLDDELQRWHFKATEELSKDSVADERYLER